MRTPHDDVELSTIAPAGKENRATTRECFFTGGVDRVDELDVDFCPSVSVEIADGISVDPHSLERIRLIIAAELAALVDGLAAIHVAVEDERVALPKPARLTLTDGPAPTDGGLASGRGIDELAHGWRARDEDESHE